MLSTHGSAAASAKRTEIRRAAPACKELPKAFEIVVISKAYAIVSFLYGGTTATISRTHVSPRQNHYF